MDHYCGGLRFFQHRRLSTRSPDGVIEKERQVTHPCEHKEFDAVVGVARLEDSGGFMAEITIHCRDCGKPFQFLGLQPGLDMQGARVSIDGLEVRIAITPQGTRPAPIHLMGFDVKASQ